MSMVRDPSFDMKALKVLKPSVTVLTEGYVDPVPALSPLFATSPGTMLRPPTGGQTSETTRFTRQIVIYYAREGGTHNVFLHLLGTGHIFIDAATVDTYNYRYYIKLQKTRDFSSFVDLTSESTAFSYSRSGVSTAGWYDEGAVHHFLRASVTLFEGDFLILHMRGTSWTAMGAQSSIGIKSATLPIRFAVIPP